MPKYMYTLTGTANYENEERDIPECRYLNVSELCQELATELNHTKATSYVLTIVCHKKDTKIPQ